MLTEEEIGTAIGARLRAEVADIEAAHDLLGTVRRRRARRSAVTRVSLVTAAVIGAAGAALAGTAMASAPGGAASHRPAAVQRVTGPTIRLDGYLITTPYGATVRKVGIGYLVTDHKKMFITLFLERGPVIERVAQSIQARGARPVRVGSMTGWWAGSSLATDGRVKGNDGGELLLRGPGMPGQEFLVIKAVGATRAQVDTFAAGLDITAIRVVHLACLHGCG